MTESSIASDFRAFFARFHGGGDAHGWQVELGVDAACRDRLIRIPTGFGKTAGVVGAWLFHRVERRDDTWPRRLVVCLPMRVLVEQTAAAIEGWLRAIGAAVKVHVLLGGVEAERWELSPAAPAILLGTQDMLLSRALNRGYGSGRARWPMSFGLLHQDALWVMDEVQLMDVGLATSAQLAAFRREDDGKTTRACSMPPSATWWMSATLQPRWLDTVDTHDHTQTLASSALRIPASARRGGPWEIIKKVEQAPAATTEAEVAALVCERHRPGTLTLVIVNRVERACELFAAIEARQVDKDKKSKVARRREDAPEVRLIHSRFRGRERASWQRGDGAFLVKNAALPPAGRIVIATQVVEAGVDISAHVLVTDLAPWSSLVQRFGRCARYPEDERGEIVVLGATKTALPYSEAELGAASEALALLGQGAGARALEVFEEELARTNPALLARLYLYEPAHLLRRRDLDDLFDTTPDLTGADLDVSRYIRSGEERDVRVFWRRLETPGKSVPRRSIDRVGREELCPVPVKELRDWAKADRKARPVYVLDYLEGGWARVDPPRIVPGMTLLVPSSSGGYDPALGWAPKSGVEVEPVKPAEADPREIALDRSAEAEEDDSLSLAQWRTIATHGSETGAVAARLAGELKLPASILRVLELAGRWHDAGKAHPVFQAAIRDDARHGAAIARRDLAKAPSEAWSRAGYGEPGFRHELASTLALLELLRRTDPLHPALVGPHVQLLDALGTPPEAVTPELRVDPEGALAHEVAVLSSEDFDLLLWLVCTHHGKVRATWTSTRRDQEAGHGALHGVREGDRLPVVELADKDGARHGLPELELSLAAADLGVSPRYGTSWADRVAGLLERHGPFALAYFEAVIRAADVEASQTTARDPKL